MKKPLLVLPALLLVTACQRPEVEAFRQNPAPLVVAVTLPSNLPNGDEIRQDYAAALRARLATRVTVVPDGVPPPAGAVDLVVTMNRLQEGRPGSSPSPAAVGVAAGVTVGALSAASGNRYGILDGLFWGLWTGTHVAVAQEHESRRLGYYPSRVGATISLVAHGAGPGVRPLTEFEVGGQEVINAMDPLRRSEADDPARVREEEARAFARVIVWRLQDEFGWTTRSKPSFYRPEGAPAEERPAAAEPPRTEAPKSDTPKTEAPTAPEPSPTPKPDTAQPEPPKAETPK